MAVALVQQAGNGSGGAGFVVTLPSPTTPSNYLIAGYARRSALPSTGPTSSHGAWQLIGTATYVPNESVIVELWQCKNITDIGTTISFPNTGSKQYAFVVEYSGVAHGAPFDQTADTFGIDTSPQTGTVSTPGKPEQLWFAALGASAGGLLWSAPTNGFTLEANGQSGGGGGEINIAILDKIVPPITGPAQTGATINTSQSWAGVIATIYAYVIETLTATIPATSTVSGTLLRLQTLNATIAASSTVSATVHPRRGLSSTLPGFSDLSFWATRYRPFFSFLDALSDCLAQMDVLSAELVIVSSTPVEVEAIAGERILLKGSFPVGEPVKVYVGLTGTPSDEPAYSGISGQGYTFYPTDPNYLSVPLPFLEPGIYRVHAESPGGSYTLLNAVTVRPKQFRSSIFALRSIMPPKWYVGPRKIEEEP